MVTLVLLKADIPGCNSFVPGRSRGENSTPIRFSFNFFKLFSCQRLPYASVAARLFLMFALPKVWWESILGFHRYDKMSLLA